MATFLYWLHVKTYTCETARVVPLVSTPTCQYTLDHQDTILSFSPRCLAYQYYVLSCGYSVLALIQTTLH